MVSSGQERRARRAQERRQMILAAARVFAREGFEKATTREVAQEADISEGTIYNYFSSKKQLVVALAEVVQAKLTAVMSELPSNGGDRANMARAIEQVLAVIADSAVAIQGLVTALWDQGPVLTAIPFRARID